MPELKQLIDRYHRTEATRLTAVLTRILGTHNYSMVEEVVQEAFIKAYHRWQQDGVPDKPQAWLLTTARNHAIDLIRRERRSAEFSEDLGKQLESEWSLTNTVDREFQEENIRDDQLRMIFMCCSPEISPENRLPLILKSLCGFTVPAIAKALLTKEMTINKRITRTKQKMAKMKFEFPQPEYLKSALESVHSAIYLLFNEGYHSSSDQLLRKDFCSEAIRLVSFLLNSSMVNADTYGLSALMKFHFSRFDARENSEGLPIGLDEQDRGLWNREFIQSGFQDLAASQRAEAGRSGRFIFEAGIAYHHCLAENFGQTNWSAISNLYSKLVDLTGSPIARLNQSVAVGYQYGAASAIPAVLKLCQENKDHPHAGSFWAVLGHLYARSKDKNNAWIYANKALLLAKTDHERYLIRHQIEKMVGNE